MQAVPKNKLAVEALGTALLAFTVAISGQAIAVGSTLMCAIYGASHNPHVPAAIALNWPVHSQLAATSAAPTTIPP